MKSYAVTDTGIVRSRNEDSLFAEMNQIGSLPNLFVVADGMGGHNGGEVASSFTVKRLSELIKGASGDSIVKIMNGALSTVNSELKAKAGEDTSLQGMGTTAVLASFSGSTLYVANVGDSRLYLLRGDRLIQITRDHSWVEEMAVCGRLNRDSDIYREKKNIITRCIGAFDRVNPDFFEVDLQEGDIVLMCTDGLTNMVSDEDIRDIIRSSSKLKTVGDRLIAKGRENGGADNLSVILVNPELKR